MTRPPPSVRAVTGYTRGKAHVVYVREVDRGALLALDVAAVYEEMRDAAAADGVVLMPRGKNSGWRSHEWQRREWERRQDPATRAALGPAARPGWSIHQAGRAIDFDDCGSDDAAAFCWLTEHAHDYGFKRTVPVERWHWEFVGFERRD